MLQVGVMDRRRRLAWSWGAASAGHLLLLSTLATIPALRHAAGVVVDGERGVPPGLVWLPGPKGGGGRGEGNDHPDPPRHMQRAGHDAASAPAPPPSLTSMGRLEPDPVDRLVIPVQPIGSAVTSLPGSVEAPPSPWSESRGPGRGFTAGAGAGPGEGDGGYGPGLGPGSGGNTGDGVYGPGSGVTMPTVIHAEKPRYTAEAMRARIQGAAIVECVVRVTGLCSDIRVAHSLDPRFGLDDEARRAAALWRFKPGTRLGQPVAVAVTIQLDFVMR